jgi:cytochrome b involved in lipid metabolism
MLDVAGDDATEAFEDVGHSDEARDILKKYKIGVLKREVRLHNFLKTNQRGHHGT